MVNVGFLSPSTNFSPYSERRSLLIEQDVLTFVVPTSTKCNLSCAFCMIKQRNELGAPYLTSEDFCRFIREVSARRAVYAVAIQGYEPLLPDSIQYTTAILSTARFCGIRASFVTNGILLRNNIDLLNTLGPMSIAVSLDAPTEEPHDRVRGLTGAWRETVAGITQAVERLSPSTEIVVATILGLSKQGELDEMPKLLALLGVRCWIISPLLRIKRGGGEIVGSDAALVEKLWRLQAAADSAGIRLIVDDTLGHIPQQIKRHAPSQQEFRVLPPPLNLIRLVPSGQCSVGADILKKMVAGECQWRPGEMDAASFLDGLLASKPRAIASAS